jgi:predicted RNase H-like nuclease
VRVIGVDLAWATRHRSGVCAVEDGQVLASACLTSDEEIIAWMRRWWADDILVAFDAPLIVRNRAGRRPCEGVFASAFAAEHAGPYPANLTLLKDDVRAHRLARRLRLRVAPEAVHHRPLRAAIEVFPHPALVVLLGRTERLPYKLKHGRPRDVCHAAMGELRQGLLDLKAADPPLDVTTSPEWRRLAATCEVRPSGRARKALRTSSTRTSARTSAAITSRGRETARSRSATAGRATSSPRSRRGTPA